MNETSAEVLILIINAIGAGILLFIAGVLQKVMNDMDEPAFKRFLNALDKTAMSNPFAVTVATLPNYCRSFLFRVLRFQPPVVYRGFYRLANRIRNHKGYQYARLQVGRGPEEQQPGRIEETAAQIAAWEQFARVAHVRLRSSHGFPVWRRQGRYYRSFECHYLLPVDVAGS